MEQPKKPEPEEVDTHRSWPGQGAYRPGHLGRVGGGVNLQRSLPRGVNHHPTCHELLVSHRGACPPSSLASLVTYLLRGHLGRNDHG